MQPCILSCRKNYFVNIFYEEVGCLFSEENTCSDVTFALEKFPSLQYWVWKISH